MLKIAHHIHLKKTSILGDEAFNAIFITAVSCKQNREMFI